MIALVSLQAAALVFLGFVLCLLVLLELVHWEEKRPRTKQECQVEELRRRRDQELRQATADAWEGFDWARADRIGFDAHHTCEKRTESIAKWEGR